jgi:enoyl-CoA hydratase/carnithine racemase
MSKTLQQGTIDSTFDPALGRGIITFNHPAKANALDAAMLEQTRNLFEAFDQNPDVSYITIRGSGGYFSSGVHLDCFSNRTEREKTLTYLNNLLKAIKNAQKVVVSEINGPCYGGAMGIVAVTDWAIASPSSTFCCPELTHGILPTVIAPYLAEATSPRQALALCLKSKPINAHEAYQLGLIHHIDSTPYECVQNKPLSFWVTAQHAKKLFAKKRLSTDH